MLIWLGAIFVGFSLGLLGSGGSILTVPILVYLVGDPEKVAIAESLAIVGSIALVALVPFALKRRVDWGTVAVFGLPGMAGAYAGAALSVFLSGSVQLLGFALVLLLAAVMMLRPQAARGGRSPASRGLIAVEGLVVGVVTGLVGVGGGFLIVPALVLLGGLTMHQAVGTSLAIIALKSITGFYKYLDVLSQADLSVSWGVVYLFVALGVAGSFAGGAIAHRLPQSVLRRVFALLLIGMGLFIVTSSVASLRG